MWAFLKKQPPIRSLIGEGTVVHGEIRFADGLRIDGEVHGDITAVGDEPNILVISEKARVLGKVNAGHVIINGCVIGPVQSWWGWALRSFGRPCVAHRVWARPIAAWGVRSAIAVWRLTSLPARFSTNISPASSTSAIPAES